MTQLQQNLSIPQSVKEKLESVRGRTLRVRLGTAVVVALGVLLAAMGLAMLVDWLATLYDSRLRIVLTYSAFIAAGGTFLAWIAAAWRRSRRIDRVAAEVDREVPAMEERWTTVAGLSRSDQPQDVHPAMFRQVAQEASSWSPRIDAQDVVPLDRLIRALVCLTAITAVLGLAAMLDSYRTAVLLKRFWSPRSLISATTLTEAPGDVVVGRGESLDITARIEGLPANQATLMLTRGEGETKTVTLIPDAGKHSRVSHRLRSVKAPLKYRLRAGDGQTPWFHVEVADRPQLGEVRLTVIPPAYTKQPPEQLGKLPRSITALEGSVLQLALKPKEPVSKAELRLGSGEKHTLSADTAGWYRWKTVLTESFTFSPHFTEKHGLDNLRPPKCEVRCRPDAPPVVNLLSPDNAVAVQPNDTLPITFAAKDDVGIGSAELVLYGESLDVNGDPVPLATLPIPLGDQRGEAEIQATVNLDLSQYELADGAELSYAVQVSEDREIADPVDSPEPTANFVEKVSPSPEAVTDDTQSQPEGQSETHSVSDSTTASPSAGNDSPSAEEESMATAPARENKPEQTASSDSLSDEQHTIAPEENTVAGESDETAASEAPQSNAGSPSEQPSKADSLPTEKTPADQIEKKPSASDKSQNSSTKSDSSKPETDKKSSPGRTTSSQSNRLRTADSGEKKDKKTNPDSKSPSNAMATRQLDVPTAQTTSSKRMLLQVDETAGSFAGQVRIELEMAIAPRLEELKQALQSALRLSRGVLDEVESPEAWESKHSRDVAGAEKQIVAALRVVDDLEKRTADTPYAFVGLQLVDVSLAHIEPARRDFWTALQTEDSDRVNAVRDGWQHTDRALRLLEQLTMRFERARREYALAESVEKIKKMYQVYVENAMALLRPGGDGNLYSRKRVEYDLDDEYLARLKEVLEMRNEMLAELARILADDPRLLRRYLDVQRNRNKVLRNELAELAQRQREQNRKTKAWTIVEKEERPQLATALIQRHVRDAENVVLAAADLHDRFETWLPLERDVEDADLKATAELLQEIATSTNELNTAAGKFIGQKSQPQPSKESDEGPTEESESQQETESEQNEALTEVITDAEKLYSLFNELEVQLRQIGLREDGAELAGFATNRLVETRRLIEQTSAWIRQLKSHQAGEYHRAAEVEQYRLAMTTDELAGKLANIEQNLAGLLQRDDRRIPKQIAEKSRLLLSTLDEQVTPNQLAAVYALRRKQLPRATSRQETALEALESAERAYDEMIERAIIELDKLPVDDPIASLLREPTLDELLAQLEEEVDIAEILGIPNRPTNLQIIQDWMQAGDNALGGGPANQLLINQFRDQQRRRQRAIEQAFRQALARAAKEANAEDLVAAMPSAPARATRAWNVLASQLEDDLRQGRDSAPPERYRQAIEQYFRKISGSEDNESLPYQERE